MASTDRRSHFNSPGEDDTNRVAEVIPEEVTVPDPDSIVVVEAEAAVEAVGVVEAVLPEVPAWVTDVTTTRTIGASRI